MTVTHGVVKAFGGLAATILTNDSSVHEEGNTAMNSSTLRQRARKELFASFRRIMNQRKLLNDHRSPKVIPFVVEVAAEDLPPWATDDEIEDAVSKGARAAIMRLAMKSRFTPGQLLARKCVPPKVRSAAARSMLAMRGGRATAAKMKALGYPNLVKARDVQRRKQAERMAGEPTVLPDAAEAANEQWLVSMVRVSVGPRDI